MIVFVKLEWGKGRHLFCVLGENWKIMITFGVSEIKNKKLKETSLLWGFIYWVFEYRVSFSTSTQRH